jgi:hypothetical protein
MRTVSIGLAAIAAGAAILGAGAASAAVLTFDPAVACGASNCTQYAPISQSYGDTAFVDVSYSSLSGFGNSSVTDQNAYYWDTGYGDLTNVVYGGTSSNEVLQIKFTALNGARLKLSGFQSAGYSGTHNSELRFYSLNYNLLGVEASVAPGTGHYTFSCPDCTIYGGFIMQLGPDGYNSGITNIDITQAAVPEPANWALLIAGFGLVGGAMRRRAHSRAPALARRR